MIQRQKFLFIETFVFVFISVFAELFKSVTLIKS